MYSSLCNCLSMRSAIDNVHAMQKQCQVSKLIDQALKRSAKRAAAIKLLILDTAESGKSTVLKQIDLIHISKFSARTRQAHIAIIHSHIIDAIDTIIEHVYIGAELEAAKSYVQASLNSESVLEASAWNAIESVWKSEAVKRWSVEHAHKFNLVVDNAAYFLDRISEIRRVGYLPSNQDILRSRYVTTGITETLFVREGVTFRILDAGRQCGQRRKWLHCFDQCTAIIFVSDISSFNMTLQEDQSVNRLADSIATFKQMWNNRSLFNVSVILFLNKYDSFVRKLVDDECRLEDNFPEFVHYQMPDKCQWHRLEQANEDERVTRAKLFICEQFMSIALPTLAEAHARPADERDIFHRMMEKRLIKSCRFSDHQDKMSASRFCLPFFTCAIDSENMKRVFDSCGFILKQKLLEKSGLI